MWDRLRKVICIIMAAVLYFWPFTFWIASLFDIDKMGLGEAIFSAYVMTLFVIPLIVLLLYSIAVIPLIFLAEWVVTGEAYERYNEYYLDPRGPIKRIIKKIEENAKERNL